MPRDGEYIGQNTLVKRETPNSGRILVGRFYAGGSVDANWQLLENMPCLDQLEAFDDADPKHVSTTITTPRQPAI